MRIYFLPESDAVRRNLEIKSLNARRIPAQATSEAWNTRASIMDQKNILLAPNSTREWLESHALTRRLTELFATSAIIWTITAESTAEKVLRATVWGRSSAIRKECLFFLANLQMERQMVVEARVKMHCGVLKVAKIAFMIAEPKSGKYALIPPRGGPCSLLQRLAALQEAKMTMMMMMTTVAVVVAAVAAKALPDALQKPQSQDALQKPQA
jgi:hypothetical protein